MIKILSLLITSGYPGDFSLTIPEELTKVIGLW